MQAHLRPQHQPLDYGDGYRDRVTKLKCVVLSTVYLTPRVSGVGLRA